jgi:hypothetical protein
VTGSDGAHILDLASGAEQWHGAALSGLRNPILVGRRIYAIGSDGLHAFQSAD